MTRLDNKYMIEMAESRGLFGSSNLNTARGKGTRGSRTKKQEAAPAPASKTRKKAKNVEVDEFVVALRSPLRLRLNRFRSRESAPRRSRRLFTRSLRSARRWNVQGAGRTTIRLPRFLKRVDGGRKPHVTSLI